MARAPDRMRPDQGTSRRRPARNSMRRPMQVISQTEAWKIPSQNMFTLAEARSTTGTAADSMLWNCRTWWNRMPSAKPPRPAPRTMPEAMRGARSVRAIGILLADVDQGPDGEEDHGRGQHGSEAGREVRSEDEGLD